MGGHGWFLHFHHFACSGDERVILIVNSVYGSIFPVYTDALCGLESKCKDFMSGPISFRIEDGTKRSYIVFRRAIYSVHMHCVTTKGWVSLAMSYSVEPSSSLVAVQ